MNQKELVESWNALKEALHNWQSRLREILDDLKSSFIKDIKCSLQTSEDGELTSYLDKYVN